MFFRLGLLTYRLRWFVVVAWIAVAAVGVAFGPKLPPLLTAGGWDDPSSESSRALATLRDELSGPRGVITLVFEDEPARLRSAEMQRRFAEAARRARALEGVTAVVPAEGRVAPPYLSEDGRAFRMTVELDAEPDEITDRVPRFREIAGAVGAQRAAVTGTSAIYYDFQIQSEHDLREAEVFTFPLAVLALVVFFGSVAAALMPVLVAAVAVSVTTAVVYLIAQRTTLSVYVLNTATMLGLAVAIDYCLLVVTRFREEMANLPVAYAVARASATAGRAVLYSGLTVLIGLSGLLAFGFPGITSVGVGGAIVVAFAVLASLTLQPAMLSILGPRIEFGRVLPRRAGRGGMWHAIATAVMRRPFLFIAAVTLLIAAIASPTAHLRLGFPSWEALPPEVESRVGLEILREHFGERVGDEVIVAVRGTDFRSAESLRRLAALTRALEADDRVARVTTAVNLIPPLNDPEPAKRAANYATFYAKDLGPEAQVVLHGNSALAQAVAVARERWINDTTAAVFVAPKEGALTDRTRALVRDLREDRFTDAAGLELLVGGLTAAEFDFNARVFAIFPYVVAGVVAVTLVILFLLLDSVVLPFKAVIMNGASVLAAYGALTFIFQDGFLSGPLGVQPRDHLETTLPILIFCVLFGVSMDYEVFLLSRMREFWDRSHDNTDAVASGLERTGRVVTSAALVFVLVVLSFARADIVTIKAIGIALATAIFLDATVVRALLVPATMRVLGRWNWWSPLRRGAATLEH